MFRKHFISGCISIVFLFYVASLFGQLDTVCVGDLNVRYGVNSNSLFLTESVWTIEGDGIDDVVIRQNHDTVSIDWLTTDLGWYTVAVYEYNVFQMDHNGDDSLVKCDGNVVIDSVWVVGPVDVDIGPDVEICFGEVADFSSNNLYEGHLWSTGDISDHTSEYREGYVWLEARDQYECSFRDSAFLTVHPLPDIDLGPDISLNRDDPLSYDFSREGVFFSWYAGDELFSVSPSVVIKEEDVFIRQTSEFSVIVENIYGCISGDTVIISPSRHFLGEIPTVITPNGDGYNDTWIIPRLEQYPENYVDLIVEIYDRWGKLVWKSKPGYVGDEWDGTDLWGRKLPTGSYFYIISLNTGGEPIDGHITIVR